ncbi:MAG: hypothetical protein KTR32_09530 [Granulosicoccus sp.]|nr:hypothetical protein [Granulosicoccus sp.]
MNALICRNCGAGLEAERIDTSLGVVTCSHCGSLHEIPNELPADSPGTKADTPYVKPAPKDVALPSRFNVQRAANSMEVSWPAGGLFHGLVLSLIAAGFAHVALNSGMLFLLAGSAGILYFALVRAFNKHRIRVDSARLQVTQGPFPWPGSRKLDASDIEQLYATEHETRTTNENRDNLRNRVRKYYKLTANTRNNERITILGGLGDPHQALWLEREIERLLGIVDRQVAGEMRTS